MTRSPEQELRHRIGQCEAKIEACQKEVNKTVRGMGELAGAVQRANDHFVRLGAEMQAAVDHMHASYAKLEPIVEVAKKVLMAKKGPGSVQLPKHETETPSGDARRDGDQDDPGQRNPEVDQPVPVTSP